MVLTITNKNNNNSTATATLYDEVKLGGNLAQCLSYLRVLLLSPVQNNFYSIRLLKYNVINVCEFVH